MTVYTSWLNWPSYPSQEQLEEARLRARVRKLEAGLRPARKRCAAGSSPLNGPGPQPASTTITR